MTKRQMPAAVLQHLEVLEDRLAQLADGTPMHEVLKDIDLAAQNAISEAARAGRRHDRPSKHMAVIADAREVAGFHMGQLRRAAGLSQAEVARGMDRVGFPWKRITVAEVEAGKRRMAIDELLGAAALFGVPAIRLLIPAEKDYLRFAENRSLDHDQVRELLLGAGGEIGERGAMWQTAAEVAGAEPGEDDWRPAKTLDHRLAQGYGRRAR